MSACAASGRAQAPGAAPSVHGEGEFPNNHFFYLPRISKHCSSPACLAACPTKAIYKRPEDGLVVIDQERCKGYRYCVKSCPYGKV